MSRFFSFGILAVLTALAVTAQAFKPVKPDFDAYISLLEADGYNVQSYDISALSDSTYSVLFLVREYENGKMIHDGHERFIYELRTRNMLSRFSDEEKAKVKPEDMDDAAKGIVNLGQKVNIGLAPHNDSTLRVSLEIPNIGSTYQYLSMRSQTDPKNGQIVRRYQTRPFTAPDFRTDSFIPLMFVGSVWYDTNFEIFRFCGDNIITPDLSSEIVSHVPHFYVIGVELKNKHEN